MPWSYEILEPKLFAGIVADEIVASLNDMIDDKGSCSMALGGGGTSLEAYRLLSRPPRDSEIRWDKIRLYFTDERWTPNADCQPNSKSIGDSLLSQLKTNVPKINSVPLGGTLEECAKTYSQVVRETEKGAVINVVVVGLGEDGSVAGLYPDSSMLASGEDIYIGSVSKTLDESRITLSPSALKSADRIIAIAKGHSKSDVVKRLVDSTGDGLPANIIFESSATVTIFLDPEAASKLSRV